MTSEQRVREDVQRGTPFKTTKYSMHPSKHSNPQIRRRPSPSIPHPDIRSTDGFRCMRTLRRVLKQSFAERNGDRVLSSRNRPNESIDSDTELDTRASKNASRNVPTTPLKS